MSPAAGDGLNNSEPNPEAKPWLIRRAGLLSCPLKEGQAIKKAEAQSISWQSSEAALLTPV